MSVDPCIQQLVNTIELVNQSNAHNKDRCKFEVKTNWNIKLLRELLVNYYDQEVVDFLQFGFPIDRNPKVPLEMGGKP